MRADGWARPMLRRRPRPQSQIRSFALAVFALLPLGAVFFFGVGEATAAPLDLEARREPSLAIEALLDASQLCAPSRFGG